MTTNGHPPGCDPGGMSEDARPGGGESFAMVTDTQVIHPLTPNPCWHGHPRVLAEHRRQMRLAAIALDRLLIERRPVPAERHWSCGGEFGADGTWREHCRGEVV
jgi:hypothetical protein